MPLCTEQQSSSPNTEVAVAVNDLNISSNESFFDDDDESEEEGDQESDQTSLETTAACVDDNSSSEAENEKDLSVYGNDMSLSEMDILNELVGICENEDQNCPQGADLEKTDNSIADATPQGDKNDECLENVAIQTPSEHEETEKISNHIDQPNHDPHQVEELTGSNKMNYNQTSGQSIAEADQEDVRDSHVDCNPMEDEEVPIESLESNENFQEVVDECFAKSDDNNDSSVIAVEDVSESESNKDEEVPIESLGSNENPQEVVEECFTKLDDKNDSCVIANEDVLESESNEGTDDQPLNQSIAGADEEDVGVFQVECIDTDNIQLDGECVAKSNEVHDSCIGSEEATENLSNEENISQEAEQCDIENRNAVDSQSVVKLEKSMECEFNAVNDSEEIDQPVVETEDEVVDFQVGCFKNEDEEEPFQDLTELDSNEISQNVVKTDVDTSDSDSCDKSRDEEAFSVSDKTGHDCKDLEDPEVFHCESVLDNDNVNIDCLGVQEQEAIPESVCDGNYEHDGTGDKDAEIANIECSREIIATDNSDVPTSNGIIRESVKGSPVQKIVTNEVGCESAEIDKEIDLNQVRDAGDNQSEMNVHYTSISDEAFYTPDHDFKHVDIKKSTVMPSFVNLSDNLGKRPQQIPPKDCGEQPHTANFSKAYLANMAGYVQGVFHTAAVDSSEKGQKMKQAATHYASSMSTTATWYAEKARGYVEATRMRVNSYNKTEKPRQKSKSRTSRTRTVSCGDDSIIGNQAKVPKPAPEKNDISSRFGLPPFSNPFKKFASA